MKSRLLLNVVVRKRPAVLELLTSEDQTLLVGWDTFLVLDLVLNVVDGVRRFDFERDRLAGEGLHEDLHTSTQTKDKMKGRLLLNVVVGKSTAILKLLAGEDKALLVRRDANDRSSTPELDIIIGMTKLTLPYPESCS